MPKLGKSTEQKAESQRASRRGRSQRVRIEDIARDAGVGVMTVSRAINNPSSVSKEKLKKIRAVIAKTGYVPNMVAGSLASNRSKIIAVLNPTMRTSVFYDMIQGMWDVLDSEGYQVLLGSTDYSKEREEKLIRTFLSRQADGLVLIGAEHSEGARDFLATNDTAVVETFDLPSEPIDMVVGFSALDAAETLGRRAAEWGYRSVTIISAPKTTDNRTERRVTGFKKGLATHGVKVGARHVLMTKELSVSAGAAAMERVIAQTPDVDLVMCTNDMLAVGAVLTCQRNGWSVPERVAITGFGDIEMARVLSPSLSTVRIKGEEIGRESAKLLLQRLSGGEKRTTVMDVGFEILRRESA